HEHRCWPHLDPGQHRHPRGRLPQPARHGSLRPLRALGRWREWLVPAHVFATTDGAATWTEGSGALLSVLSVDGLAVDATSPERISWATPAACSPPPTVRRRGRSPRTA